MALRDVALRNAKIKGKSYKLRDGDGLFLLVHNNGSKYWRFRYRHSGKEKMLAFGVYPEVSLQEARDCREAARKLLRAGKDPSLERALSKRQARIEAENDFESVARDWLSTRNEIWTSNYSTTVLNRLERDIFPKMGRRPISQITPAELLDVLKKIENRGAVDTAHRMQQVVGQIFRYAVGSGIVLRDITGDLRGSLKPARKKHHARLSANELPDFLGKLNTYEGDVQTINAAKLLLLTFVRTTELRGATWREIDMKKAEWRIPAERMKMRAEHVIPLSKQALELFGSQQLISEGFDYVFPNRNRPRDYISENTILGVIYRLGYQSRTTGHGFRGIASTILHEQGFPSDVIERQLAHKDKNAVRASYNHAAYLPARREMMQWWGDYLEKAGMNCEGFGDLESN